MRVMIVPVTSRAASTALSGSVSLLEAEKARLIALQEQLAAVAERESRATAELKSCKAEREALGAQIALVLEAIYAAEAQSKGRARIGDKRYRVLSLIREAKAEGLSLADMVSGTGSPLKRVREQVASDLADGVLAVRGERFRLTGKGADLMARYEARHRDAVGELPHPELPHAGSAEHEADPETQDKEG